MWLLLGTVAFVAAVRASKSLRAMYVGRVALAALLIVFGAFVNLAYLLTAPEYFADFGEMSQFSWVRETWASLVVPYLGWWIALLILFEAAVGVLLLSGGRWTQAALVGLMAFHVGILFFGWGLWAWAVPMLITFALLLRAERYWVAMAQLVPLSTPVEPSRHVRT